METLFLKLLGLSVNAGWAVLAVILLRLFQKKTPKRINKLLWAIVGLRLVLPFSVESKFSIIPSSEFLEAISYYSAGSLVTHAERAYSFMPEFTAVWLVGAAGMLVYAAVNYICFKYRLRTATPLAANIRQSEAVSSPCLFGIIKPRIYLPYRFNEKNLSYVLAHEQTHLKRHDHWLKLFAFLILCVYWFNPLLWLSYILLCRDIELACDESVVKNMQKSERQAYSKALVESSVRRRSIAACPLAFGEVSVKARVRDVMNYKAPGVAAKILAAIACIITAVCLLTNPATPYGKLQSEYEGLARYKQFDEGGCYVVIAENYYYPHYKYFPQEGDAPW